MSLKLLTRGRSSSLGVLREGSMDGDRETQKLVRVHPKTKRVKDGPVAFSHILQVVERAKKIGHSGSSWFFSSQVVERSFAHATVFSVGLLFGKIILVTCFLGSTFSSGVNCGRDEKFSLWIQTCSVPPDSASRSEIALVYGQSLRFSRAPLIPENFSRCANQVPLSSRFHNHQRSFGAT